ncbi:tetratricopeptide repeat protein [Flavobacteriaceae bacterium 3-367]
MRVYLQKFNLTYPLLFFVLCIACNTNSSSDIKNKSSFKPIIERLSIQGNWKDAIDIANIELQKTTSDKQNSYYYLVLGQNYFFLEDYDLSAANFKKVIDNSKKNADSEHLGEAYYGLGDINYLKWAYFKQEEALNISKAYLDSSLIQAKQGKLFELESKVLYRLGTILQIQGQNKESLQYFEKGLKISFSISDTAGMIRNDTHKAAELMRNGKLDSALFHYTRAYNYGKQINSNYTEAHSLCNLGQYYFDIDETLKAKSYFDKAMYLSEELGQRIVMCRSYYGLSLIERRLGNKENAAKYAKKGLKSATDKEYSIYMQVFMSLVENIENDNN